MANKATPEELAAAQQLEAALEKEAGDTAAPLAESADPLAGNKPADNEPPKRKRGRPFGSKSSNAETLLNESLNDDGKTGTKSAGRKSGKKSDMDPASLAKQLVGIHQLVAMITGIPEAQIQEEEGKALATAIVGVCNEYDLSVDGKTGAAIQLFAAAAMIYTPRVLHYNGRKAKEQAENARDITPANH